MKITEIRNNAKQIHNGDFELENEKKKMAKVKIGMIEKNVAKINKQDSIDFELENYKTQN